jgi:hypothetical protein
MSSGYLAIKAYFFHDTRARAHTHTHTHGGRNIWLQTYVATILSIYLRTVAQLYAPIFNMDPIIHLISDILSSFFPCRCFQLRFFPALQEEADFGFAHPHPLPPPIHTLIKKRGTQIL